MIAIASLRALCLGLAALILAGCAGGAEKIEAIYEISAPPAPAVSGTTSAQILVPEPRALEAYASNKIPVKPTPLTLSYYPSVALQDTAPKVMQRVMLDTFQNTGRVRAVGLPGQSLLINYQVVTELRAFHVETFAGTAARIEVSAKLLNDTNGRVVTDRVFSTVVPITSDSADTAAEGLNLAAQALAADVVAWTLTVI
ncbi:MAG: ABC-type transport auxiliary lipoprotein family protein [Pseudomonadota bacterium]